MTVRIRNINVIQYALVYAVLSALAGILVAILAFPAMALFASFPMPGTGRHGMMALGFFPFILMPLFYGVFGFVAGIVIAALYNLVAGWTGGIEATLETVGQPTVPGGAIVTS